MIGLQTNLHSLIAATIMGEKRPPRITIVVVLPTQEAYELPMTSQSMV